MSLAIEYIENHLKEDISISDVAKAVGYSLYHFSRTFNATIHHTPYNYLIRRRLSESAQELSESDRSIIEIAIDYKFNNPETYSRAFKRLFGVQPREWKKLKHKDMQQLMPRLTPEHIKHLNKGDYLKPVFEEKPAFQVAGVMGLIKEKRKGISDLWAILSQELKGLKSPLQPVEYFGITHYPRGWQQCGYLYLAAIEFLAMNIDSLALVRKNISAHKYARFIHKGADRDLKLTQDYIYHTWLPKSDRSLVCSQEIECFGSDIRNLEDEDFERAIYIPIQ